MGTISGLGPHGEGTLLLSDEGTKCDCLCLNNPFALFGVCLGHLGPASPLSQFTLEGLNFLHPLGRTHPGKFVRYCIRGVQVEPSSNEVGRRDEPLPCPRTRPVRAVRSWEPGEVTANSSWVYIRRNGGFCDG